MKLTKKLVKELTRFTQTYWDTYLSGDIKTWATFLSDDYHNIGTTKEELWNSKQEILDYTYSVIDQMIGMAEVRNRKIDVIPYQGYFMVHELADIYVKAEDGWTFYAPVRLSTLVEKNNDSWLVLHQHGSYPDSRTEEGETFAFDTLKAENKKLMAAVEKRTQELGEKNKALELEAALEKVRSAALAMNKPDDMVDVCRVISNQLELLGVTDIRNVQTVIIDETKEAYQNYQYYAAYKKGVVEKIVVDKHPLVLAMVKEIRKSAKAFFTGVTQGKELQSFRAYRKKDKQFPDPLLDKTKAVHYFFYSIGSGALGLSTYQPLNKEGLAVFKRFHKVFTFAYQRFVDLEKAIAQAREAEIELALERVRARAMAMQKSGELANLIITVFQELQKLDMELTRCLLWIFNQENKSATAWMTNSEDPGKADSYHVPYHDHPAYKSYLKAWKNCEEKWAYHLKGKGKDRWDEILVDGYFKSLPSKVKKAMKAPERVILSGTFNKYGIIQTASLQPLSDQNQDILQRFSQVFEQTYTRFLDLQKAEAQAREAQIEAALEKVRSRTMAMQKSEEMPEVANNLFRQVQELGFPAWSAGYCIWEDKQKSAWCNMSSEGEIQKGFSLPTIGEGYNFYKPLKNGEPFYVAELGGKKLERHYDFMKTLPVVGEILEEFDKKGIALPTFQIWHIVYFKHGYLMFITYEPVPTAHDIFKRFGQVFDQTYTRFLDLQKAEEQAREAQIEASLERVRSKAMAMHSSEDLVTTASQLFKEFQQLNISFIRCGVLKINEDRTGEVYSYSHTKENEAVAVFGNLNLAGHELLDSVFKYWKLQEEHVHELKGDAVKRYYQLINKQLKVPKVQLKKSHFGYAFYFPEGSLYCFTNEKLAEETLQILRRFNAVMGLTYRRYFELMEAEERELAAIKESSLDRVRAEIASMRTATDLGRITPLIWRELTHLGVPFFRCGIFIINEDEQIVHAYLSTPEGEAIAALHIPFNDKDNLLIKPAVENWRLQRSYKADWDREKFIQQTQVFMDKGQIEDPKSYQIADSPPERLVLHLVPFKQGMLYVGNSEPLSPEHMTLMQDLANAFAVAYARYEDFKQLEEAKEQVEETLSELKSTQTQLIQSEKMASLGELTAGIAHEIQNPLNFVNNFSEVSGELVDELEEEIEEGNLEDVKEIATDLKQNLEKINHHGQRASDIVKSMLEHSRTGDGSKELTDINKLADEYVRLSYHGLRAKDKSFNAEFKLELDEALPQIKVVPQDIGRVLLNLINNAFQAVGSKPKTGSSDFSPEVVVSTRVVGSPLGEKGAAQAIEVSVKDNGPGIPDDIKDKIFEPFFTTKPTGEGTGLGLSMSYDIITKGHGGELKVESKEARPDDPVGRGEGTEFVITLPVV